MINPTHFLEERNILSSYLKVKSCRQMRLPSICQTFYDNIHPEQWSTGKHCRKIGVDLGRIVGCTCNIVIVLISELHAHSQIHKYPPSLSTIMYVYVIEVWYIQFIMVQTNEKFLHVFISLLSQKNHKSMLFNFKMFLI